MADVFISYSKEESEPIVALARDLERRGYTTWWDSNLHPGERFRERIRMEIAKAKAVIVVWTRDSVHSDWVIAEAELAHRQNKLITVRTPELDPAEIPPPFNTLHTEFVSDREKIYRALSHFSIFPSFFDNQEAKTLTWRFRFQEFLRFFVWKNVILLLMVILFAALGGVIFSNANSISLLATSLLSQSSPGVALDAGNYSFPQNVVLTFLMTLYCSFSFSTFSLYFLLRQRLSISRDELNKLRQELDDAVRFANNVTSSMNPPGHRDFPHFDTISVAERCFIGAEGDTKVEAVFELECVTTTARIWNYWIDADAESKDIKYLRQLNFRVTDIDTGRKLDWLQIHNTAKKKVFAIFFPDAEPGIRKKIRITYSWAGYMGQLIQQGVSNFTWQYISKNPEREALCSRAWIFDRSFSSVHCRIIGMPSQTAIIRLEEYGNAIGWIYEDPRAQLKAKYEVEFQLDRPYSAR